MRRTAIDRRLGALHARVPSGCPACRALPPLVILWEDDPDPLRNCTRCGRAMTGTTWVRLVQDDRGPR